ncbi:IPT/TIG domain-containing protein [Roseivirga sp. BDSF3-8]|uniref:IPT/TIG domain-containing protein n=1 Tax=Roseivirga sp. BDSF3-8 TaxID=3241598 RepID=UPI0035318D40
MRLTYKNQLRTLQAFAMAGVIGFMTACGSDDEGPEVMPAPTVSSFSPDSGLEGETITINGTNFSETSSENSVNFSSGVAATVTSASSTSLEVEVPTGAVSGPVSVTVDGQTGTSTAEFTVLEETMALKQQIDNSSSEAKTTSSLPSNIQYGYHFTALKSGDITDMAVVYPTSKDVTVYVWADENETLLDSLTITSATSFNYVELIDPIALEEGKKYRITMYIALGEDASYVSDVTYPFTRGSIELLNLVATNGENTAQFPKVNAGENYVAGFVDFVYRTEK